MSERVSVTITRQDKYRFVVDFGGSLPAGLADEPPPLGEGSAPSPVQLLASAMANCLAASLVFAHGRYKEDPGAVTATATCEVGRNEKNRYRVTGIDISLTLGVAPETLAHLDRVMAQFEDYCTVSQSVKTGIPYTVTVKAPDGRVVKAA
ncbi:MAG: OsmC family protein [Reyranellaceae bacterium]